MQNRESPFSSELQLVLLTAKTRLTEGEKARVTDLAAKPLDWEMVLTLAGFHRTFCLLNLHVKGIDQKMVPANVRVRLKEWFEDNVGRNLLLSSELIKILRVFRANGISAVPFKGPLLAERFYGNLGYRTFLDLDILVQKQSISRSASLLEEIGYIRPAKQIGDKEQLHLESQVGFDFQRHDGKVLVELNWALIQKWLCFHLEPEVLWSRLGEVTLGGMAVPVLSIEDEFLFLCAHGAKHQWERLFWLTDIVEVISSGASLNWERLLTRAEESGSRRMLLWALRLAHELFRADVPPALLEQARGDPVIDWLTQKIIKQLAAQKEPRPVPGSKSDLLYILEKDCLADKGVYLIHLARLLFVPTSKDRQFAKLPKALSGLYFLVRPVRVLFERLSPKLRQQSNADCKAAI